MEWNLKNIRTLIIKYFNEKNVIFNVSKIEDNIFCLILNAQQIYRFIETDNHIFIKAKIGNTESYLSCSDYAYLTNIIQIIENECTKMTIQKKLLTLAMEIE